MPGNIGMLALGAKKGGGTGIHRYAENVLRGLRRHGHTAKEIPIVKREVVVLGKKVGGYVSTFAQRVLRPRGIDVLHAPHLHQVHAGMDVMTIHDMVWTQFEDQLGDVPRAMVALRPWLRRKHIISPSAYAAASVEKFLGATRGSVHVAHLGVDFDVFQRQPVSKEPVVLMVGDLKVRKSSLEVIKAMAAVPSMKLVRIGPAQAADPYAVECRRVAKHVMGGRFVELPYGSTQDLVGWYNRATVLAYPSKEEGFGFPPLEAAACGTPSIVSECPVFQETIAEAAIVAKGGVGGIEQALRTALGNPVGRGELQRTVSRFTWENTVQRHVDVYRAATRRGGGARYPQARAVGSP